jgi:hypothetical protein
LSSFTKALKALALSVSKGALKSIDKDCPETILVIKSAIVIVNVLFFYSIY